MNKKIDKLVYDYLAIEAESAKEEDKLGYMARAMVMATLPHSKPKNHFFERTNGDFTLTMIGNPKYGLPYGTKPRLILAWITREVVINKTPELHLGKNFVSFLNVLKFSQSGGSRGDATALREQMLKLFTTQISYVYHNNKRGVSKGEHFSITRSYELWWNLLKIDNGKTSLQSKIVLSKDFFEELRYRPVPVNLRMLQALRRSPLQIDIYTWLTYRFSYLKKSTFIPWNMLSHQFGSNYALNPQGQRDFKKKFLQALRVVMALYHEANLELQDEGIILKPSATHVKTLKKDHSV